jgi:O-antigen/teichoic acid export membrane protein
MTRKGGHAYLAASLTAQVAALLRYVLLARMLGPTELGYAAMLILTSQFFESVSDTGSDRFLIQDPNGDSPTMQGVVHFVMAMRGLLIAIALAVFAAPLAGIYKSPGLVGSIMILGIYQFIAGFAHLDTRRLQRHGDFRQDSAATIVSETAGLIGTVGAAYFVRDHTAVIYGLAARAACLVIVSHIAAQRPYRWAFSKTEGLRFSRFAAPLFLNGLLLFAGSQGDRLIVGSQIGPEALGHYSAILLLIYYPTSALKNFVMGIHLPQVANANTDPAKMEVQSQRLAGRCLLIATATAAGFAVVGPIATPILYGHAFAQGATIFALLGCLQSTRFLRAWPTTMAIALGRSTIVMFNNLTRTLALPLAVLAALWFHSLLAIVAGFLLGEIAALLVALVQLARAEAISLRQELRRAGEYVAVSATLIASGWSFEHHHLALAFGATAAAVAAVGGVAWQERMWIAEFWREFQRQAGRFLPQQRAKPSV